MLKENKIDNSTQSIKEISKSLRGIEPFAKKASKEIKKGSFLGYFYIASTLILVPLVVIITIGFIIGISRLFPSEYKWIGYVVSLVPLIALFILVRKSLQLTSD